MLIVNATIKVGSENVEPGLRVPTDLNIKAHILTAYIGQRVIVEGDEETRLAIRAKFLAGKKKSEMRIIEKGLMRIQAEVLAAEHDVKAAAESARAAEEEHANLVAKRQAAEADAEQKLYELNAQLAELTVRDVEDLTKFEEELGDDADGDDADSDDADGDDADGDDDDDADGDDADGEPAPKVAQYTKSGLHTMTKGDLLDIAGDFELDVDSSAKKNEVVEAIMEAQANV